LAVSRKLKLAGKSYEHKGFQLVISDTSRDKDQSVKIGVVSAIKDVSAGTKHNIAAAIKWFKAEGVEWLVANGDLALEEFDLEEVIDLLGESGLTVLVVLGNSESKGSWARAYKDREAKYPNLVNGTWVRQIIADDVEFWTVPGYHDKEFVHQGASCLYKREHIDAMLKSLKPSEKTPVVLVAHGPPAGQGKYALDWMAEKRNVGDPMLNRLIDRASIPFGFFGHILEAGGAAVGKDMTSKVNQNAAVSNLYLNAGSLSGDPWGMNDGSTSTGIAVLITIDAGKAKYEVKRFKPPVEY